MTPGAGGNKPQHWYRQGWYEQE